MINFLLIGIGIILVIVPFYKYSMGMYIKCSEENEIIRKAVEQEIKRLRRKEVEVDEMDVFYCTRCGMTSVFTPEMDSAKDGENYMGAEGSEEVRKAIGLRPATEDGNLGNKKSDSMTNFFRIAKSESGRCRIQYNVSSNFLGLLRSKMIGLEHVFYPSNHDVLGTKSPDIGDDLDWRFLCDVQVIFSMCPDFFSLVHASSSDHTIKREDKFFDNEEQCIDYILKLKKDVEEKMEIEDNERKDKNVVAILDINLDRQKERD